MPSIDDSEIVVVSVELHDSTSYFYSVYIPPSNKGNDLTFFEGLIQENSIIGGDFNIDAEAFATKQKPKKSLLGNRYENIYSFVKSNKLVISFSENHSLVAKKKLN